MRLKTVAVSDDRVAKVLHTRYGSFRVRALSEQLAAVARERRPVPEGLARQLRELEEAVEVLQEQLADKEATRRRVSAGKAARESRELAARLRRRLMEVDGTDELARERTRQKARAML